MSHHQLTIKILWWLLGLLVITGLGLWLNNMPISNSWWQLPNQDKLIYWVHLVLGWLWLGWVSVFLIDHIAKNFWLYPFKTIFWTGLAELLVVVICNISGVVAFIFSNDLAPIIKYTHRYSALLLIISTFWHLYTKIPSQVTKKKI